jgi:hypothetical protein
MNPAKTAIQMGAAALVALAAGAALAAPPDWGKVPAAKFTLFYPGVATLEWATAVVNHSGARGIKNGETCASCHSDDPVDFGKEIASGKKLEPHPIKGKTGYIPITVQAAHDADNLYLRFTWKQPSGSSGEKMDKDNQVKLTVMLGDDKVDRVDVAGCWVMCHNDLRTMPDAKDPDKTKYVKDGSLASGKFLDLIQWASKTGMGGGYVADKRVMTGSKALVDAKGEKKGDEWEVVFTRRLQGDASDISLASGKTYNIGFAIHDDYTAGRFHDVSLDYTLGIDTKADITANKE